MNDGTQKKRFRIQKIEERVKKFRIEKLEPRLAPSQAGSGLSWGGGGGGSKGWGHSKHVLSY
jgi:hypothetical protein